MKNNNLSKLGYLMEILSINVSELSHSINIERTTVSKWKNGGRKFLRTSNYFEPIVEYLIKKNNNINGNILDNFFISIYQNKNPKDKNYIINCVRSYLSEITPINAPKTAKDDISLYHGTFTVYGGIEGRQLAIMDVLDTALKDGNKGCISILESNANEEFIQHDKNFTLKVINKIKALLDKGFNIEITYILNNDKLPHYLTTEILTHIIFHKNLTQLTVNSVFKDDFYFTYYLLKDRILIMGLQNDDSLIYTTKYTDPLTIKNTYKLYTNYKESTKPFITFDKIENLKPLLNILNNYLISNDVLYYHNCSLWIVSMSYELLMDILISNNAPKDVIEYSILYYNNIKKLVLNYQYKKGGLVFSQKSISELLKKEFVLNYELTAIAGYDILLNHEQYTRHIEDTIKFINENPNIAIKVNDNLDIFPYALCLNKVGLMISNRIHTENQYRYIYIENSLLTKTYMNLVDKATSDVPDIYSDNIYLTKLLKYLIDNHDEE